MYLVLWPGDQGRYWSEFYYFFYEKTIENTHFKSEVRTKNLKYLKVSKNEHARWPGVVVASTPLFHISLKEYISNCVVSMGM